MSSCTSWCRTTTATSGSWSPAFPGPNGPGATWRVWPPRPAWCWRSENGAGGSQVTRRVAVAMLAPTGWTPPGVAPFAWRTALAEDAVDLLATLAGVDAAVAVAAADRDLAEAV